MKRIKINVCIKRIKRFILNEKDVICHNKEQVLTVSFAYSRKKMKMGFKKEKIYIVVISLCNTQKNLT